MNTPKIQIPKTWFSIKSLFVPYWIIKFEWYIRVKIFKQRRYLIARYYIEPIQELESQHGINLEQELTKILTNEIKKHTGN